MPQHNKKPDDLIWYLLNQQAKGVKITHIINEMNRVATEENRPDWKINRTTAYDILRRYNVGTRSETEALHRQMVKEAGKITRMMIRHMNGTVPREAMLAAISDFDAKWVES
jgi:hypothetical protein